MTNSAEPFEAYRGLLFSIAYRMLGSATEAEDMVQETYLRFRQIDSTSIESMSAYLSTIITRLCLNHQQKAYVQRETYLGPWLPEPIETQFTSQTDTPENQIGMQESVSLAFMVLLESLSPVERAVFLLREVFEYEYSEIAEMVGKSDVACRKLFSRAKQYIAENRPRYTPSSERHALLLENFMVGVASGNLDNLMQLLEEDVVLWTDGGGQVTAALYPIYGPENVARFIFGSLKLTPIEFTTEYREVNGEPAIVLLNQGRCFLLISIEYGARRIQNVRVIANPAKLIFFNHRAELE